MIDDGATDWKVTQVWTFCLVDQKLIDLAQLIAMNVEEADKLNIKDMASLESAMPGIAQTVQKFFRVYKVVRLTLFLNVLCLLQVPAGDGENKFAYDGEIQDRELAEDVVE